MRSIRPLLPITGAVCCHPLPLKHLDRSVLQAAGESGLPSPLLLDQTSPLSPFYTQQGGKIIFVNAQCSVAIKFLFTSGQIQLWQFLMGLLQDEKHSNITLGPETEESSSCLIPGSIDALGDEKEKTKHELR